MEEQTISRKGLKELYNLSNVCDTYKSKIKKYLESDLFSEEIEISQTDVEQAFIEANTAQKKHLLKYFKSSSNIIDEIGDFKDILKHLKITEANLNLIKNPKSLEDKCLNATKRIFCITRVYNQGWWPDFTNSEYKYYPYKYFSGGRWASNCCYFGIDLSLAAGLYFKSSVLALDALEKFPDIYDDYFMVKTR